MSDTWYARDIRKAIDGMTDLTPEERGCYGTVVDYMYLLSGALHDDDRYLAGLMNCDVRVWRRIRKQLLDKGKIQLTSDGRIEDVRASSELARRQAQRSKKVASGQLGGIASGEARKNKVVGEAHASPASNQIREEEKREEESSDPNGSVGAKAPPACLPVEKAFEAYNAIAENLGLPVAKMLTRDRRTKLAARLHEHGLEGWLQALGMLSSSPHCLGENDRCWRADLDFLLSPSKFNRLLEGGYTRAEQPPAPVRPDGQGQWIVKFGTREFTAWREELKRQGSPKQWQFREEEGCEVQVPDRWPRGRKAA